jgi:hypothetical protein
MATGKATTYPILDHNIAVSVQAKSQIQLLLITCITKMKQSFCQQQPATYLKTEPQTFQLFFRADNDN